MVSRSSRNRLAGQNMSQTNNVVETIVREAKKIGRNEKVTIRNISSGEEKIVKYKIAENQIKNGDWVLINNN